VENFGGRPYDVRKDGDCNIPNPTRTNAPGKQTAN
jgi:hypothetical protein